MSRIRRDDADPAVLARGSPLARLPQSGRSPWAGSGRKETFSQMVNWLAALISSSAGGGQL